MNSELQEVDEPVSGDAQALKEDFTSPPDALAENFKDVLNHLVDEPDRRGLKDTPERVASAFHYLTEGYRKEVDDIFEGALFEIEYDEMVIVKNIDYYSLCEHHMLPFYGQAHIAYVPDNRVVGLSKLSRLVDAFARRLQVQERLTTLVAETLRDKVQPKGVGVVIEGQHLCMMMRGVQKENANAVTSSMLDLFKRDSRTRMEFLELLNIRKSAV